MARKGSRQVKIPAHIKEGEKKALTCHWQKHFLDHLAESSNITESAKVAGINPSRAYLVRRQDPTFARQWLAALWEGYLHLELEVLRRLREGDLTTFGSEKYDFANAIRLLAAHRDNAVRAQAEGRQDSPAGFSSSVYSNALTSAKRVVSRGLRWKGKWRKPLAQSGLWHANAVSAQKSLRSTRKRNDDASPFWRHHSS